MIPGGRTIGAGAVVALARVGCGSNANRQEAERPRAPKPRVRMTFDDSGYRATLPADAVREGEQLDLNILDYRVNNEIPTHIFIEFTRMNGRWRRTEALHIEQQTDAYDRFRCRATASERAGTIRAHIPLPCLDDFSRSQVMAGVDGSRHWKARSIAYDDHLRWTGSPVENPISCPDIPNPPASCVSTEGG